MMPIAALAEVNFILLEEQMHSMGKEMDSRILHRVSLENLWNVENANDEQVDSR